MNILKYRLQEIQNLAQNGPDVKRMQAPSGWFGFVLSFDPEQIIVSPPLDIPGLGLEETGDRPLLRRPYLLT